ncbi:MAG: hypothetical protein PF444_06705 [Bacteroidales bacterium]|jgi:hypothetical protein|nr:hypothetical protein [Bacteroidales bacterium]
MTAEEFSQLYQELVNQYTTGVTKQDAKLLNAFVKDDRVLQFKDPEYREQYTTLRLYRAECFILFGMFPEGIKECRLALLFADKKQHWEIYMLWTQLHYLQFLHTDGALQLKSIAEAAILVAQKGRHSVVSGKEAEYQRLSFINMEAFFSLYLGQRDEAKALFSSFKFTPIPIPQYNDESALTYLFSNYAKGLAVAIELQDEKLLRHLLKVISIDDETLLSGQSLFKIFHATLVTTMDTHPTFATEFNQLFQLQDKVKGEMKELSFFLSSIRANMMQALEVAFSVFK